MTETAVAVASTVPSATLGALAVAALEDLKAVDIRVLDHFIVAGNTVTSFAEHGWL